MTSKYDLTTQDPSRLVAKQTLKAKLPSLRALTPKVPLRGTILLADISGSMKGEKLVGLQKCLSDVWAPGLQAIVFNHALWELEKSDINHLEASGSTNMLGALQEAWSRSPKHLILITDGYPNQLQREILAHAQAHNHVPIDTIGISDSKGRSFDPQFLQDLARITGGKYNDITKPLELSLVVQHLITEKSEEVKL
uniref:Putative von Willebrand factor A domain-containing protein n=1 Tax=viral metagenome TaxID=1070528 RepID=A0A6M3KB36_9ZZZZ